MEIEISIPKQCNRLHHTDDGEHRLLWKLRLFALGPVGARRPAVVGCQSQLSVPKIDLLGPKLATDVRRTFFQWDVQVVEPDCVSHPPCVHLQLSLSAINAPMRQRPNVPTLQHSNTPTLQRSSNPPCPPCEPSQSAILGVSSLSFSIFLREVLTLLRRYAPTPIRPTPIQHCSSNGQRELKGRASGRVGCRPQTSIMSFDNRTADRQAHAHP
jgi:hypothetical protein